MNNNETKSGEYTTSLNTSQENLTPEVIGKLSGTNVNQNVELQKTEILDIPVINQNITPEQPSATSSQPVVNVQESAPIPQQPEIVADGLNNMPASNKTNNADIGVDPFINNQVQNENVGIIPPEKVKKKKGILSKILFTLLILILIGGVAYGIYYYLNKGTTPSVALNKITLDLNDEKSTKIEDYANFSGVSSEGCILSTVNVNNEVVGNYEYTITCGEEVYKEEVIVVDRVKPEVEIATVYKNVGDEVTADEFVESCSKENCVYSFDEEVILEDLTKEATGLNILKLIIKDEYGNTTEKDVELIVTTNKIIAYLKATSNSKNIEGYTGSYTINNYLGIDNSNNYADYAYRVYEYDFTNEEEFEEVLKKYENAESFMEMTGDITFDKEEKILYLKVPLTKQTLDFEYEGSFPTTYNSIRTYYLREGYSVQTANK